MTLNIRLLGEFHFSSGDHSPAVLKSAREQTLLAYLLLHRNTPQRRQHIAFLLWPDSTEAQALSNLRRTLHHLRRNLPDIERSLQVEQSTLQWSTHAPFRLDVAEFEDALDRASASVHPVEQREMLVKAVELYGGELVPDCYDDWIAPIREHFRSRYIHALEELTRLLEDQGDYAPAIRYAETVLRSEPLHEATYRHLMRLHALDGDRAAALSVFHRCVTILERELGVGPGDDLQKAYQRLLQHEEPTLQRQPSTRLGQGSWPLVGREAALKTLRTLWQSASRGQAHFVLIAGEPGMGKTRLAEEMLNWVDRQGIENARTRAYAAAGDLAYAPVIEWLRAPALQAALHAADDLWLTEIARLLPELMVQRPTLPRPGPLQESWQRRMLFEALARVATGDGRAKLLLIDDLQWCDSETLAWLAYLMAFNPNAPLLIIGTARSEEIDRSHPLTTLLLDLRTMGRTSEIELLALNPDETVRLAMQVAQDSWDAGTADEIYGYTEGNPLYIIETVRAGMDDDAQLQATSRAQTAENRRRYGSTLPEKVQVTIQRRLAQLSPAAHDLAGLAAIVGQSFSFPLLALASDLDEERLVHVLDELWQRRIVREQANAAYDFTHDRIREVTLTEVSAIQRRRLHKRVAQALESLFPDKNESLCGRLGWHYAEAMQWSDALRYDRLAIHVSAKIGAEDRVLLYAQRVLTILDHLPKTPEHVAGRIDCWLQMSSALIGVHGWTSTQRKEVLDSAYQWASESQDEGRQLRAMGGLCAYYENCNDWTTARRLSLEMVERAREFGDEHLARVASIHLGCALLRQGEVLAALDALRQGSLPDPLADSYSNHLIHTLSGLTEALWLAGYVEQAHTTALAAIQIADKHGAPYGRVHSRDFMMCNAYRAGERTTMHIVGNELTTLCAEYHFPDYAISAQIHLGWLAAVHGNTEIGLSQIKVALASAEQMKATYNFPYFLTLLAQAQRLNNQTEQALQSLAHALELSERSGDLFWKAEILRLTGECHLDLRGAVREAEEAYTAALTLARQQHTKVLELRAAASLARLWRQQGKRAQGRHVLTLIYDWFPEGFQSVDLRMARALLDELADSSG